MSSREIVACRACQSRGLSGVFDLGLQALTGVFPLSPEEQVIRGPVRLRWCKDCQLVQLGDDYEPADMYGSNYGYESSLNGSMVAHLQNKVTQLERTFPLSAGDHVIDIGSNDATLLKAYSVQGLVRIGIDPVGPKFKEKYTGGLHLLPTFFSADSYFEKFAVRAKMITSIAMFYDLPDPLEFLASVVRVLDDDGIWHFEQSYLPSMLRTNSFDTVCHEHVEYYSLKVVRGLLDRVGLEIIDVQLNSVNGGSFAVTAAKKEAAYKPNKVVIDWLLKEERKLGLDTPKPYLQFAERSAKLKESLVSLVRNLTSDGYTVAGYGASTKGNVTLQYCGFGPDDIVYLAEVNSYKFGRFSPGTGIPIVSEEVISERKPDYLLMLPWHFREGLLKKESEFLKSGGKFIIPFPYVEIVA